ncbi:MAG: tetratricopeptide repeat protein [Bryobacteraceae bacterium]
MFGRSEESLIEELGVTRVALRSFFKILNERHVPVEDLDSKLRQIAKQTNKTRQELQQFKSEDPFVTDLKKQAGVALESGRFDEAERLLNEAVETDNRTAKMLQETKAKRLVSAAASKAQIGALKYAQLAYTEAVQHYQSALELLPQTEREESAKYLNNMGTIMLDAGKYDEAEKSFTDAMKIWEDLHRHNDPRPAVTLNNMAMTYVCRGRYDDAETLVTQAHQVFEALVPGSENLEIASSLNNLAVIYGIRGKYREAARLLTQALRIFEKLFGPDNSVVATCLETLAITYSLNSFREVRPLLQRTLRIRKRMHGPNHPHVALSLQNLAFIYQREGRWPRAERLLRYARGIYEQTLGTRHPGLAVVLSSLGEICRQQQRYAEARRLHDTALSILRQAFGKEHSKIAFALSNLGLLYLSTQQYKDAESCFTDALEMNEKALGLCHPVLSMVLNNLGGVYHSVKQYDLAAQQYTRALGIALDVQDHPQQALILENLAAVYDHQKKSGEARLLRDRSRAVQNVLAERLVVLPEPNEKAVFLIWRPEALSLNSFVPPSSLLL